jgi:hypothetical protein
MRSIKAAVMMVFTVLALTSAAPALATTFLYDATTTPVTAKGETHSFTAGEAIITCKKAEFKYSGTTGKHSIIDVTPAYKECKVLESTATVTVEKAMFEFGIPHEVTSEEYKMTSSVVGEAGAKIKVTATISGEKCEVTFPAQTILGETTRFANNLGKTGGEVKSKLEGVEYKSNSKCAGFVGKEGKNGTYEGTASETGLFIDT